MFWGILFLPFAYYFTTVCAVGRCPFPGITANATFVNKSISWQNRTSFEEGDVVQYVCLDGSARLDKVQYSLTCRSNGTWNKPLPRCGLDGSNEILDASANYQKWSHKNCLSNSSSAFYSIKLPEIFKEIDELKWDFCSKKENAFFYNSTLDEVQQCYQRPSTRFKIYSCTNFDPKSINYSVTIHMNSIAQIENIYVMGNSGTNCGWPPVPLHADVVTDIIPGQTTEVAFKCNDFLVFDPEGPQNSTCDQMTGQWTLPRCICPDLDVPAKAEIVNRTDFTVRFRCAEGYSLVGQETIHCDEKGFWTEMPSCKVHHFTYVLAAAIFGLIFSLILTLVLTLFMLKWKSVIRNERLANQSAVERNKVRSTTESNIYESLLYVEESPYEEPSMVLVERDRYTRSSGIR